MFPKVIFFMTLMRIYKNYFFYLCKIEFLIYSVLLKSYLYLS